MGRFAPDARTIRIRVPATSGNMGPGFDVLGLAYALYNDFRVRPTEGPLRIEVDGAGADLPTDESNLFYRAFAALCRESGRTPPPLDIRMCLRIPAGRGLGSSATAVVGGLHAANHLLGLRLSAEDLLPRAVALEHGGHPDNVAPALLGGLVVNTFEGPRLHSVRVPFPEAIKAVIYMPDFAMDTIAGPRPHAGHVRQSRRGVQHEPRGPAAGRPQHGAVRPARGRHGRPPAPALSRAAFPALPDLLAAARVGRGLWRLPVRWAARRSWLWLRPVPPVSAVAAALCRAAERAGLTGEAQILDIDREGATVTAAPAAEDDAA